MTDERRTAGLISQLTDILLSKYKNWQLTSDGKNIHLTIQDNFPNIVHTFRDDTDIIRCISALKGGE